MSELTEKQRHEAAWESWQARVLMGTMDGEMQYTLYSAVIREALRKSKPGIVPRVSGLGWISVEGHVYCNFWDRQGVFHPGYPIAVTVADFTDAWRLLADKLRLTDQERVELFAVIRGWIGRDERNVIPLSANDRSAT